MTTSNVVYMPDFAKKPLPDCIGYFEIAQFMYIGSQRKPNWFHRTTIRALMGWKWHDGRLVKPSHPTHNLVIGYGLEYQPPDQPPAGLK